MRYQTQIPDEQLSCEDHSIDSRIAQPRLRIPVVDYVFRRAVTGTTGWQSHTRSVARSIPFDTWIARSISRIQPSSLLAMSIKHLTFILNHRIKHLAEYGFQYLSLHHELYSIIPNFISNSKLNTSRILSFRLSHTRLIASKVPV